MNLVTLDAVARHIGERTLFENVRLRVNVGDRIGLIGVNGCGKSTLLRLVAGAEAPDKGSVTLWGGVRVQLLAQEPVLDDADTVTGHLLRADHPQMRLVWDYRQLVKRLQQSPDDADLQAAAADLTAEMDRVGGWDAEVKVRTILTRLGIREFDAPIATLSGGQRKRVALARALLDPADLLILDEPTNHLDADAIAWLEEYLLTVPGALLMVTHDRYFLDRVVNRILEIDRRELIGYPGNYTRYLELRAARHERLVAIELRRQNLLRRELAWLRRAPKARTTKQRARTQRVAELARLEYDSGEQRVAIALAGRRLGERVLEARRLGKSYGPLAVLRDVDLDLAPGERIGIIGPNGAGKTTLLDVLAGRLQADGGSVKWGPSVELGYFDQRSAALDDARRVIELIEEQAPLVQSADGKRVTAAQMLEWFLFDGPLQHARIGSLSGGERRRLYLLWTLVRRPNVLFLDEPTNDLDVPTLTVLEEFLDHFRGCLIVVSHDRYFLDRTVDELILLEDGRFAHRHPAPFATFQRLRQAAEFAAARVKDGAPSKARPAARGVTSSVGPRRLSWKERQELARLEARIAELEARKAALGEEVARAVSDYLRLESLSRDLTAVDAELDAILPRWLELGERVVDG